MELLNYLKTLPLRQKQILMITGGILIMGAGTVSYMLSGYDATIDIGKKSNNGVITSYGSSIANSNTGDTMMVALDMVAGKLYFGFKGKWMGSSDGSFTNATPAFSNLAGTMFPIFKNNCTGLSDLSTITANFGASVFKYTIPSGFQPINNMNQGYDPGKIYTTTTSDTSRFDSSDRKDINGVKITEELNGGQIFYAIGFNGRYNRRIWNGTQRRPIARKIQGIWQYAKEGANNYAPCKINNMNSCLSESFAFQDTNGNYINQMDKAKFESITDEQWEWIGGSNTNIGSIDLAFGLYTPDQTKTPRVLDVSFDYELYDYTVTGLKGDNNTGRSWADGTYAKSCYEYRNPPEGYYYDKALGGDGLYNIDLDGPGGDNPYQIWCDMTTMGGGWTPILKAGRDSHNYDPYAGLNPYLGNVNGLYFERHANIDISRNSQYGYAPKFVTDSFNIINPNKPDVSQTKTNAEILCNLFDVTTEDVNGKYITSVYYEIDPGENPTSFLEGTFTDGKDTGKQCFVMDGENSTRGNYPLNDENDSYHALGYCDIGGGKYFAIRQEYPIGSNNYMNAGFYDGSTMVGYSMVCLSR